MEKNNTTDLLGDKYPSFVNKDSNMYSEDLAELRKSLNIFSVIVYCLVFVLGVLGNGVVIWVTGFKMKKTVNTVWFLNLAVADFLVTAFLPLNVTHKALGHHWPFGNFMCKFHTSITFLNMFASVYILVVISVDRCVSVVWPVWAQNHRNVRKASCVSLGVWMLALILSALSFDSMDTEYFEGIIVCYIRDLGTKFEVMIITYFLLGFVVPFTVIVSSYAVIIHRLRRNRTLSSQSSRAFKIIAAVIITFFLCWAPFHIMRLLVMAHLTNWGTFLYSHTLYYPIVSSLIFLNSCINPLLYGFMGQNFKDKSILNRLKNVFQEEVSPSHTYTNAMTICEPKSVSDVEVLNQP